MAEEIKNISDIRIADDVVASIAGLAACEVDGVSDMAGNIGSKLMNTVGVKTAVKGVKVDVADGIVRADLAINVRYGFNVMSTCKQVQDKVKAAIENMTGLKVTDVIVRVAGIDMEARAAE